MKLLTLDIETNTKFDTIWCCVCQDVQTDEVFVITDATAMQDLVQKYDKFIAHNGIGFDFPVLRQVWNVSFKKSQVIDTLVMSRLNDATQDGGHSLRRWGNYFGYPKGDFTDYDGGLCQEMIDYCIRDVELTTRLYKHLLKDLKRFDYEDALQLETETFVQTSRQERNGFAFDLPKAMVLLADIKDQMGKIEAEMQATFPPIVEERWSEKTGKRLKDKVTIFNVGSRKQIGERLQSIGWKPKEFTESGQPKVDESILSTVDFPEAQLIARYLLLQKREGLLKAWIKNEKDGRIHGKVIPIGAVTHRMSHHSPNLAQVPSINSEYGKECRELFTADEGWSLVGADLSGIELRCLAHYMKDDKYTKEILEGDIHTANQKAAGLPTRNNAKTFIYAFLYGAGDGKLGDIVGSDAVEGGKLRRKFLKAIPKMQALITKVQKLSRKGYVPALDGRHITVNSEHSALNMLLQSAGAIIAKQWMLESHKLFNKRKLKVKQCAIVHDELQVTCPPEQAEQVGEAMVEAAGIAGDVLNFRVPVAAEYSIGKSWLETH